MSINLSTEKANELFKAIGVDVAVVADSESADQNPDIENISKGVFNEMETKMRHDLELEVKDKARGEEAGKQLGTLRRAIKRHFGLDEKETSELSMDDMVKLAKEKINANKADAESDIAQRFEAAKQEWETEKESLTTTFQKERAELEDKFISRDIKERILNIVNNTPRVGGDPMLQAEAIFREIKGDYITKINPETKELEFFSRENPEKRIFDGKNLVTDKYKVENYLKGMGLFANNTSNIKPADVLAGTNKDVAPGISAPPEGDVLKFLEETFK